MRTLFKKEIQHAYFHTYSSRVATTSHVQANFTSHVQANFTRIWFFTGDSIIIK